MRTSVGGRATSLVEEGSRQGIYIVLMGGWAWLWGGVDNTPTHCDDVDEHVMENVGLLDAM